MTPAPPRSAPLRVEADADFAPLLRAFLGDARRDASAMSEAAWRDDAEAVRILGHRLKGAGGGYGLPGLTELGAAIERHARNGDLPAVREAVERLEAFLTAVVVVEKGPSGPARGGRTGILVVDDMRSIRALVAHHLARAGFTDILHAASASEARSLLDSDAGKGVGLILLDVLLPDADGIEFLADIRAGADMARTPVLIMSSDLPGERREAALAAGARGFVPKPLDADVLLARVRETLGAAC